MVNLIKQLIKESVDNLSQEELNQINDTTNKRLKYNQEKISELKNDIKPYQYAINIIKQSNKYSPEEKNRILNNFKERVNNIKSSINSFKEQTRDDIYKSVYNNFIQNKKYQQEIELNRKNKTFNNQDIENLFVTALEGGSNYWYYIKNIPKEINYQVEQLKKPLAEAIANHVINGGYIQFFDAENENELLGTVDMDKLLDAISLLKKDYPDTWNNILDEDCDADCADIFLQLAVMGELTFG